MAERGMLPDVKARQIPNVNLSPEIVLLEKAKIADNSHLRSLISSDGRAHLFLVDCEKQIHHIEVCGNEVLLHEIVGAVEGSGPNTPLDAVEHPTGCLRILAGDKQFIRSAADKNWQKIKGNLCSRFITAGDDLFCAFIANGKEIGAPPRRDWTVGLFMLIPIAFWSDIVADKLVLAQESRNGWVVRAVFDPETKLSARPDFMFGTARDGSLHFLYRSSGESTAFIIAFGGYSGEVWAGDISPMEIRFARVQYNQLLSGITNNDNQGVGQNNTPSLWSSIQGLPLTSMPYVEAYEQPASLRLIGPLDRHFAVNSTSDELSGLFWSYGFNLDDGIHKMGTPDLPWIQVKIKEGRWDPHFDIVTASDLPESGVVWRNDRNALLKNDSKGKNHVLLIKTEGFWVFTDEMCYFLNSGSDWSAPLILGSTLFDSPRSLAVDETGKVFTVWENKSKKVVGRWILPSK